MSSLNENTVENAALEWFGALDYAVRHGSVLAPGEPAAERESFNEVVLVGRFRDAINRINPKIPEEAREDALRKVLRVATPSLVGTNRLFHAMLRDGIPVEFVQPEPSPRPSPTGRGGAKRRVRVGGAGRVFVSSISKIPPPMTGLQSTSSPSSRARSTAGRTLSSSSMVCRWGCWS